MSTGDHTRLYELFARDAEERARLARSVSDRAMYIERAAVHRVWAVDHYVAQSDLTRASMDSIAAVELSGAKVPPGTICECDESACSCRRLGEQRQDATPPQVNPNAARDAERGRAAALRAERTMRMAAASGFPIAPAQSPKDARTEMLQRRGAKR